MTILSLCAEKNPCNIWQCGFLLGFISIKNRLILCHVIIIALTVYVFMAYCNTDQIKLFPCFRRVAGKWEFPAMIASLSIVHISNIVQFHKPGLMIKISIRYTWELDKRFHFCVDKIAVRFPVYHLCFIMIHIGGENLFYAMVVRMWAPFKRKEPDSFKPCDFWWCDAFRHATGIVDVKEQKLTAEQQTPGLEKKTHLHISSCNCVMNPHYLLTNGQYYLDVIMVVFSVRKYGM